MLAEKTVLLPVSTDEAFALITEPDRLRRWKSVSARVDLRAGGQYRWTVIRAMLRPARSSRWSPVGGSSSGGGGKEALTSVPMFRLSPSPSNL
jgi:uncharacterized protein YndB with AHSA1/START domain